MGKHGHGYRNGTRYMFQKRFRKHGPVHMSTYLRVAKTGDYVDIVANSGVQKGMPHKTYHGRTGIIYNVTKRSVGVEVNKQVRNRIEIKRVNVRVEHIRPSKCRTDFLARVKRNEEQKREAKKNGIRLPITAIKRFPVAPKAGYVVPAESEHGLPMIIAPQPFDDML